MRRIVLLAGCLLACSGCSNDSGSHGHGGSGGATTGGGSAEGGTSAGEPSEGGSSNGGSSNGGSGNGGSGKGGEVTRAGSGGGGGKPQVGPLTPAKGTPGEWEEVTSPDMDPSYFSGSSAFGAGNIVSDPARPTDMYVGGYGSIWKSTDYGLTWTKLDCKPNPPSLALGHVLAVAGTTPATLWMANISGAQHVYRSTDGGLTFTLTGAIPEQPDAASLYSIVVDPNDDKHLISGLHEQDKVLESSDAGDTWHFVSGSGWPDGGKSWFPFFVDTGDAATTSKTWFAIAQDGASAVMTSDGGKTWTKPKGLEGLQHPHGGSNFYQNDQALFVAGLRGPEGDGVYRSTDLGKNWARVAQGSGAIVWGTPKNLYAMWGWACSGCGTNEGGPQYQTAPQPGTDWAMGKVPDKLDWGPNSVAVTSDGKHSVFVGAMWATGLWRYVEP